MSERAHGGGHRPRCLYCGDIIGAYEPFVVSLDDGIRVTSLAAEPELFDGAGDHVCYHRACCELTGIEEID